MPAGKVIFFNRKNKFGFIKCNDDGNSYYVQEKNLIDRIEEGDHVEFELKEASRGKEAIAVKKVNSAH